jgi:hypothetical protein
MINNYNPTQTSKNKSKIKLQQQKTDGQAGLL